MKKRDEIVLAVAAVITDDEDRILLTLRSEEPRRGYWHHPGGVPEFGESLIEALQRELREEIGVEVKIPTCSGQPCFVTQTIIPAESRHIICLFFRAKILGGQTPRPLQGTAKVGWFDEAGAKQLKLLNSCRDFLEHDLDWDL